MGFDGQMVLVHGEHPFLKTAGGNTHAFDPFGAEFRVAHVGSELSDRGLAGAVFVVCE